MEGDLSALIISGQPNIGDLAEAWANIYSEYLDMNGDNERFYILQLQKEMALVSDSITDIETCIFFLSIPLYKPELTDILKSYEIDYPFDLNKPVEYQQSLDAVHNRLASLKFRLEQQTKEYDEYMAGKDGQVIDANYFNRMLIRLARFRHVSILRAADITVKEFVLMIEDYLDYVKSKQKTLEPDGQEG